MFTNNRTPVRTAVPPEAVRFQHALMHGRCRRLIAQKDVDWESSDVTPALLKRCAFTLLVDSREIDATYRMRREFDHDAGWVAVVLEAAS